MKTESSESFGDLVTLAGGAVKNALVGAFGEHVTRAGGAVKPRR